MRYPHFRKPPDILYIHFISFYHIQSSSMIPSWICRDGAVSQRIFTIDGRVSHGYHFTFDSGCRVHRFQVLDSGRSKRFCKFKSMFGYLVHPSAGAKGGHLPTWRMVWIHLREMNGFEWPCHYEWDIPNGQTHGTPSRKTSAVLRTWPGKLSMVHGSVMLLDLEPAPLGCEAHWGEPHQNSTSYSQ